MSAAPAADWSDVSWRQDGDDGVPVTVAVPPPRRNENAPPSPFVGVDSMSVDELGALLIAHEGTPPSGHISAV